MKNPWMSLWLRTANTWAGAARGFWTAEMHRQRKTMLKELKEPTGQTSGSRPASAKKRPATKQRNRKSR